MPKPNFFIVGAPKSGTTALSEYLGEHSDIFMSDPKEPHYFATDMPRKRFVSSEPDYLELFAPANERQRTIGEASVWYLYSESAAREIKTFDSTARLIVMLRNPVDLVYSMHSQHLFSLTEDVEDFEQAWRLNDERRRGEHIPRHCKASKLLLYDEIAKLGDQLERVLCLFPRDQVMIVFFEDFIRDTGRVYREVLQFLGVPDDGRQDFAVVNPNKRNKSRLVALAARKPPRFIVTSAVALKRWLGLTGRFRVKRMLKRVNAASEPRPELADALRREMIDNYRDDIAKLSKLTGRDLSAWMS